MMRTRALAMLWMVMGVAALGACGQQGGELREATERRRQLETELPDDSAPPAAADDQERRLPAFVFSDSQPAQPAAPGDTAPPAQPADTPAPSPPASPESQATWTRRASSGGQQTAGAVLRDMRLGVNQGFERLVLDFGGARIPRYRVSYADGPVRHCASDEPARVAGDAILVVDLDGAQAHNEAGRSTIEQRERRVRLPLIQEVEIHCDFEGQLQVLVGLSSTSAYRVLELPDGRLVVDVRP